MSRKFNSNLIVALCTALAVIAFALDQRHTHFIPLSVTQLFIAAAVICVVPAFYKALRCRMNRHKTPVVS